MEKDRMPGGWKIASALLGFVVLVGLGWAGWLQGRIDKTDAQIHIVQTQMNAENKERSESQRKTDVSIENIKGKLDSLEKNVERVEKGQEKIKDQLEKNAVEQQRLNNNLEQLLRQRGRTP